MTKKEKKSKLKMKLVEKIIGNDIRNQSLGKKRFFLTLMFSFNTRRKFNFPFKNFFVSAVDTRKGFFFKKNVTNIERLLHPSCSFFHWTKRINYAEKYKRKPFSVFPSIRSWAQRKRKKKKNNNLSWIS